jgi:O-antigen ligase
LKYDHYAHDEYLQFTADDGLVGAALLALLLVAVASRALAGRRSIGRGGGEDRWVWAGAVAGLVYLAGHSAFDFLWHVPAVVLVAGVLVGISWPPPPEEVALTIHQNKGDSV